MKKAIKKLIEELEFFAVAYTICYVLGVLIALNVIKNASIIDILSIAFLEANATMIVLISVGFVESEKYRGLMREYSHKYRYSKQ